MKLSNFLLPIYFGGRAASGLVFHVRFDAGLFWETVIVAAIALLQIWLTAYKEVDNTQHSKTAS